jgi:dynein heavy chain
MDQIQEQIDGVEEEAGIVKDLYDLVEQYQVPVNPEDMAIYQVCIHVIVRFIVRNCL